MILGGQLPSSPPFPFHPPMALPLASKSAIITGAGSGKPPSLTLAFSFYYSYCLRLNRPALTLFQAST